MGWQMKWPKCSHEVAHGGWTDAESVRAADTRPIEQIDYSYARCLRCDRPLLFVAGPVSADHLRHIRRHVAWWMLDKEGEHASNTVVVKATYPITRGHLE